MTTFCDGVAWFSIVVRFSTDCISLLLLLLLLLVVVVVGETAGKYSIPVLPDPALIQCEPGHEPGGLQEEDAGQT